MFENVKGNLKKLLNQNVNDVEAFLQNYTVMDIVIIVLML